MDSTDNMDSTDSTRVTLASSDWCYTPGLIRELRQLRPLRLEGEATERASLVWMLAVAFPDAPAWALIQIVEGDYAVEKEAVVVTRKGGQ